jgi:lytic cellulose monooxygenase (C1-hydroxylating)
LPFLNSFHPDIKPDFQQSRYSEKMKPFTALVGLLAVVPQMVSAHGFVSDVKVSSGAWFKGSDPVWFYSPAGQGPKTSGWDSLNQDLGFVQPASYGSADIACHKSATSAKGNYITAAAGETLTFYWNTWPESHKGPIINYLAPYNGKFPETV